jgi:hypothetical protein
MMADSYNFLISCQDGINLLLALYCGDNGQSTLKTAYIAMKLAKLLVRAPFVLAL